MARILQPYHIGITQGDTSPDETLLDVFHSLERLNSTIDDIFGKVEKRVVDERDRINKINTRVEECRKIVQSVRGSKKATTIFSTAKFPAPKVLPAYPTLLSQVSDMPTAVYRELDENTTYYPPLAHESVVGNEEKLEESYLIYGRFNTHESDLEKVEFTMEDEGIGPYPLNRIKYIGSMLLFNTNINPYKNYETLDNFIQTGRVKEDVETEANGLAAAPNSLVVGDVLPDIEGLDFTFKPEMGEMAQLSLPDNLPLDFVAENINYQGADLPSIAPSAAKANYDLPQITDGGYDAGPTAKQKQSAPPPASIPAATINSNDSVNSKSAAPPPPPPPPMSTTTNQQQQQQQQQQNQGMPPPPPPQQRSEAAVEVEDASDEEEEEEEEEEDEPSGGGAMGGLLAAIRGADVTKLRKVAEKEVKTAKKEHDSNKPLSMMDEMRARMQRRNSAISGRDSKIAQKRESAIIQQAAADRSKDEDQPNKMGAISESNSNNGRAAPPPPPRPKSSALLSMGFQSLDNDDDDKDGDSDSDEDEPPIPSSTRPTSVKISTVVDDDFSDSDTDDDSDVSDVSSFGDREIAAPITQSKVNTPSNNNVVPTPEKEETSALKQAEAAPTVPIAMPTGSRRGTLLDEDNKELARMLAAAKESDGDSDSDSNDDEWD